MTVPHPFVPAGHIEDGVVPGLDVLMHRMDLTIVLLTPSLAPLVATARLEVPTLRMGRKTYPMLPRLPGTGLHTGRLKRAPLTQPPLILEPPLLLLKEQMRL